jgi:hypothetical protein
MENPDKWKAELERVEELQEEKKKELPFGYDYILEILEEIACSMNPNTLFQNGVVLGTLIQVIIANKEKE